MRSRDRSGLLREWTVAFVAGELIGFVPPAVTGAALGALGVSDPVMVAALTAAGSLEGAALGWTQARVLHRYRPALDRRAWIGATAAGAAFAWFVGMGGGALMGGEVLPVPVLIGLLVPAWTAALCAMGWAQWRVLRRGVPHSGRWVPVNAGAWLVGVMIPMIALTAAPDAWPPAARAVVGVVAAVAMGATVGAITGRTLRRLLADAPTEVRIRRRRGGRGSSP